MPYDASIPLAADSPSLFPIQSQTNFGRLETIVGSDHQFNASAAANDGYHNIVNMTEQAPSGVLANTGRLYAKESPTGKTNLFYMDEAALDYQITPTMPIRAAVNFDGTGANGVLPAGKIRSFYNVSTVEKTETATYLITFTTAMPDANYIVQVTGMAVIGTVLTNVVYGDSVKTASVSVRFLNATTGSGSSPLMANVTIFSVT